MTERPILFSGPMVRAILRNEKTQTRRVVKPVRGFERHNICRPDMAADPWAVWWHGDETDRVGCLQECHYGKPGDHLWVREKWASPDEDKSKPGRVAYDADGLCGCWIGSGEDRDFIAHGRILGASGYHECFPENGSTTFGLGKYSDIRSGEYPSYRYGWRPSIFMPRWASRTTLEITDVRVERVQDISEEDAWAEGVRPESGFAIAAYTKLWDKINAKRGYGWDLNPWVWVLEFKRLNV
ncbi:MAG: hypothetical protein LC130_10090 [Bryobacterales bacterium]|nr:hypothetical protein [Bryobacterales bacterium]